MQLITRNENKMRTVKTKKELIKAIKDGETKIKVDYKRLLTACKLAELYQNGTKEVKRILHQDMFSFKPVEYKVSGEFIITITIIVVMSAIAIITILIAKKAKIKVDFRKGTIEIEFEK